MVISLQNIRASFVVIDDIAFQCTASQKECSSIYNHVVYFVLFLIFYFLLAFRSTEKEERGLDLSKFSSDVSKDSSRFMGRLHAPR